jgi:hypothetical protein
MRILVLLMGLALAGAAAAQEFGRLFFTPEQRAALDARRRSRVPEKAAPAPLIISPTTRLDGYVRRSDGRSTVWVNGDTADDSRPQTDGSVAVSVGEGPRVRLKPGEVLDRSSGEVTDVLGERGEIRVRPAR